MSDDQDQGEVYGSDPESLHKLADDLAVRREAGATEYQPPPEEEQSEEPATKIPDYDDKPISWRKAGDLISDLRAAEATRRQNYAEAEAAGWAAGVAEGQQQAAAAQAAQQPAQAPPQPDPVAAGIAQLTSQERQLAIHEQNTAAHASAIFNQFNAAYADINTPQAQAQLAQADPQRFQQYLQDCEILRHSGAQYWQAQQAREVATYGRMDAEFTRAANIEDAKFLKLHPELARDEAQLGEVQKATMRYLTGKGLSEQLIGEHWNGRRSFSLREGVTQDILLDAVRWNMAQEKATQYRNGQRGKNLPPVQRPGVARDRGEYAGDQIAAVTRALNKASGNEALRLAVRLNQLKREAGQL